ncbi:MAG: WG repeat-containing protein [Muribaculaceae bacterium]|nr:WG repeat-containing protein [Muribaculaceae bacterium]
MRNLCFVDMMLISVINLWAQEQILQARKDSESKKYGYENVGEKKYWWAEAHKLGNGKEELNSDMKTEWVIAPQYDKASKEFSEGLAAVEINGKVGFIDRYNRFVIEPQFEPMDDMEGFHYGMAVVKKDGKYGYIDKRGNFVFSPGFDKAENFGDDLMAVVKMGNKFGCIDLSGDTVVPCSYLAKEIMKTVPIKNKPYKEARKTVKTRLSEGYYSDFLSSVINSETYTNTLMSDPDLNSVSSQEPKPAIGSVSNIQDGYYLWTNGENCGIMDSYGREILQPVYKSVDYQPKEHIFVVEETVHGDGKPAVGLLNRSGGWIIPGVFESISKFGDGVATAKVGVHSTKVDVNGLVETEFIENMLKSSAEEKGTYYTQRLIGIWPACAAAHNNMGIFYASSCDDLKHAINHFTVAHRLDPENEDFKANMKAAKSERNSRRWNRVLTGLQIAGAVLTIGAVTYSTVSGNTAMSTSDFSSSGIDSYSDNSYSSPLSSNYAESNSGSNKAALSEAGYMDIYRRYERNAKSVYEALTREGTRKSKDGKAVSGTSEGSWGMKYTQMKRILRDAQKEMRKLRREASRNGITIPESEYESVTVSD